MPWTYRHSHREFQGFLQDARDRMCLESDNSTYTAVQGVLHAFRARLTPQQVIDFAQVLPSVLQAVLIQDWRMAEVPQPWASRAAMTEEVKALRRAHNLAPDNAIEATAYALRRCVRAADLGRVLARIGPEAEAFWAVEGPDSAGARPRII
ncbi:DUF2267 domain-containing protein [Roseobacteraceae bacterium NS-SX3]